ncbi:unnamed protein product, partial [marine sediment metagenome]
MQRKGEFILLVSESILNELERVLNYKRLFLILS